MTQQSSQVLLLAIVSVLFGVAILVLARRQLISFRYMIGWLILASVSGFTGLLIPLTGPIARLLRVSELTLVLASAVVVLLAVCVQLSISISGLQKQVQRLAEEIAISVTDETANGHE